MASVEQQITLAMGHLQSNRHAEGEAMARAAVEVEPYNGAARHVLGLALYLKKDFVEAAEHFAQAIRLEPRNALYASNCAENLRRLGRLDESGKEYERATILMPEFLKGHLGLGGVLREMKRFDEAVARFRLVLAINPRNADAYYQLGQTYLQMEREEEAIPLIRKAVALRPRHNESRMVLASLLQDEGEDEEAIDIYREILSRVPKHVGAMNALAGLLKTLGRIEEAQEIFDRSLATNPAALGTWYGRSRTRKGVDDPAEIEKMEEALTLPTTTPEQKVSLHFALGKVYDDIGAFEKAFRHFETANRLDERGEPYNADVHSAMTRRVMSTFDEAFFRQRAGMGSESEQPVFVLGMPRSGTTLCEQIIASHPDVFGAGELKFVGETVSALKRLAGGGYPDCMHTLDAATALGVAEQYIKKTKALAGKQRYKRITDKMPGNFMHVGLIATLFPRARIFHLVREPLDVCLSCFSQYFAAVMPFSKSLQGLGRYWADYSTLMEHWHKVLPGRIHDVRYPDLVNDLEPTARGIIAHCGLDWNDACLEFHKTERPIKTASSWQVRQPIYTSSLDRWKNYESFLGPLIEAMGDRYRGAAARPGENDVEAEDMEAAQ